MVWYIPYCTHALKAFLYASKENNNVVPSGLRQFFEVHRKLHGTHYTLLLNVHAKRKLKIIDVNILILLGYDVP